MSDRHTESAIREMKQEMVKQDAQWGDGRVLPPLEWFGYLAEEMLEVITAINDDSERSHIRNELLQVAAVAVQAAASINREDDSR